MPVAGGSAHIQNDMQKLSLKSYICSECKLPASVDAEGRCELCRNRGRSLATQPPSDRYAAEIVLLTAGVIIAILIFFWGR